MISALEEIQNKKILSACSRFEKLPKILKADFEMLTVNVKMLPEKERFHVVDLFDKILISLNEVPWESITLPIFKYWCDLFLFEIMFYSVIKCDKSYGNLMNVATSVNANFFRFYFRALIHFKKVEH